MVFFIEEIKHYEIVSKEIHQTQNGKGQFELHIPYTLTHYFNSFC